MAGTFDRKVDESRYYQTGDNYRKTYAEAAKMFDIDDEKWGHPMLVEEGWAFGGGVEGAIDASLTPEERYQGGLGQIEMFESMGFGGLPEDDPYCDIEEITVPGCPEEPDTPAKVYIFRPKEGVKKNAPCLVYCFGGGMVYYDVSMFPISEICAEVGAIGIAPAYRYAW